MTMARRSPLDLPTPLDGKPHRVSMGLRTLDVGRWLLVDERRDDELREKARLLGTRPGEVFAALPGSEAAGAELLGLVESAVTEGPEAPVEALPEGWRDLATGLDVPREGLHPVDAAARLVQEDLCLMERDASGQWVLTAASVCFPSRWLLADKIGRSLSAIHDPVPGYDRIDKAADQSFDRLTAERPVIRSNWTLIDDPALFQPRPESRGKAGVAITGATDAAGVLAGVFLRVERQTLRLLPRSGAIVFTIRTRVEPLAALAPEEREHLAATLRTVDDATVVYKGWERLLPRVLEALNENR
jgi:hypothetical protein